MAMRPIYSWQHQSTSRGRWILKRLLMAFISYWEETALSWTAWCYTVWTGHAVPTEKMTSELAKGEMVLQGSCFMKESARHFAGYRRKWQTVNLCGTVLEIFCFMEKSAGYYGPIDWRLDVPMLQKNSGWLSRLQDVSVNSRGLEVACNVYSAYLGNILSFCFLWWSGWIDNYNCSFP